MMADEYSDDDDSARPWKKRTERLVGKFYLSIFALLTSYRFLACLHGVMHILFYDFFVLGWS